MSCIKTNSMVRVHRSETGTLKMKRFPNKVMMIRCKSHLVSQTFLTSSTRNNLPKYQFQLASLRPITAIETQQKTNLTSGRNLPSARAPLLSWAWTETLTLASTNLMGVRQRRRSSDSRIALCALMSRLRSSPRQGCTSGEIQLRSTPGNLLSSLL